MEKKWDQLKKWDQKWDQKMESKKWDQKMWSKKCDQKKTISNPNFGSIKFNIFRKLPRRKTIKGDIPEEPIECNRRDTPVILPPAAFLPTTSFAEKTVIPAALETKADIQMDSDYSVSSNDVTLSLPDSDVSFFNVEKKTYLLKFWQKKIDLVKSRIIKVGALLLTKIYFFVKISIILRPLI